jgi:hypothetical protein
MLGRPRRRQRILLVGSVAVITSLALAIPASVSSAAANHSKAHPYTVGHFHRVGTRWAIKVLSRDLHANRQVHRASHGNAAPPEGFRYVLVKVRGKLTCSGVGGLGYDESFRLIVNGRRYSPANVDLHHGLAQTGVVHRGEVVTGEVPFLVTISDLQAGHIVLRAASQLDWHSPAGFFRTH